MPDHRAPMSPGVSGIKTHFILLIPNGGVCWRQSHPHYFPVCNITQQITWLIKNNSMYISKMFFVTVQISFIPQALDIRRYPKIYLKSNLTFNPWFGVHSWCVSMTLVPVYSVSYFPFCRENALILFSTSQTISENSLCSLVNNSPQITCQLHMHRLPLQPPPQIVRGCDLSLEGKGVSVSVG